MELNSYWRMVKSAQNTFSAIDRAWKQDGNEHSLIYDYKVEEIVREVKESLVYVALAQILAKHDIHNVTIPEEVRRKINDAPEFSVEATEEAIKEPYIAQADTEAHRQLIIAAQRLIPFPGWDRKARLADVLKGRRLTLRVHWSYTWVDQDRNLTAFQILFKAHREGLAVSKCKLEHPTMEQTIGQFRGKDFAQARRYVYDDGIIEEFRIYKNGHLEITFKKEADAEEAAKILLEGVEA